MPLLSELTAASDVSDHIHAVEVIKEDQSVEIECRLLRIAKTAISVEDSWNWLLWFLCEGWQHTLLSYNEHWNLGSILAFIPSLISSEIRNIQAQMLQSWASQRFDLIRFHIESVNTAGIGESLKLKE